ncbi:MAG: cobalamin-dependent protein [Proteobacteria bacterium]|nr:cobalamin-dependent protein [Pseudomonadota bacterium]
MSNPINRRVLIAKTGLDGHWRGVTLVAQALRDAGFEVVLAGMARAEQIVRMAEDEDVQLIGLNVGGHIEVVERILDALNVAVPDIPVFAGGIIPPWMVERLAARGVEAYPPGSALADVVSAAQRLTSGAAA